MLTSRWITSDLDDEGAGEATLCDVIIMWVGCNLDRTQLGCGAGKCIAMDAHGG